MKRPDPPSDRDIVDAFRALDGTIPDGHLDDFSSRVLARLDEPEARDMDSRELARGSGLSRPDEAALGAVAAATSDTPARERDENSGLHEIKALASTTRRRISQKITSETEAEESLLVGATSGSFRAAALPDPAREKAAAPAERAALRGRERLDDARPVARPASAVDSRPLPARASSAPFWVLGGVATAAAAAAVAVFVFGVGRSGKQSDESTGGDVVARADQASSPTPSSEATAAAGAPAQGDMRFAEPPPAEQPAPGAAPAAAATPAIARGDAEEEKAADESGDGDAKEGALKGRASTSSAGGKGDASKTEHASDKSDPKAKKEDREKEKRAPLSKEGGGGKDLNDVLDQVTGGVEAPAKVEEEGPKKPSKKGLDRRDVAKAMSAVRSQVMRCRDKEQFEGTVSVKFHVAPSGQVTSAEATGSKAGTPTGACVAAAVKRAVFPAFDGAPTSFTYPFLLAE